MKRFIYLILAAILSLTLISCSSNTDIVAPDGGEPVVPVDPADPVDPVDPVDPSGAIRINTEAELISSIVCGEAGKDKIYVLNGDIVLGSLWTPKCSEAEPFLGSLDGGGHKIGNLRIETDGDAYGALFAVAGYNDDPSVEAVFKNLTIEVDLVTFAPYTTDGGYFGALLGQGHHVIIDNVHILRKNSGDGGDIYSKRRIAGGLAGWLHNSTVTNSSSAVNVELQPAYSTLLVSGEENGHYAGGFAGLATGDIVIDNCSSTGNVYGVYDTGGFIGQAGNLSEKNEDGEYIPQGLIKITNSHALGDAITRKISGGSSASGGTAGGFIGSIGQSFAGIQNCYAKGSVGAADFDADADDTGIDVGGFIGIINGFSGTTVIESSYAAGGHVRGNARTGGFIGAVVGEKIEINNSYVAVGRAGGGSWGAGGFIGVTASSADLSISHCYTTASIKTFSGKYSGHSETGGFFGTIDKSATSLNYVAALGSEIAGGSLVAKAVGKLEYDSYLTDLTLSTVYSLAEMVVTCQSAGYSDGTSVNRADLAVDFFKGTMQFDEAIWDLSGSHELPILKGVSGQD